MVQKTDNEMLAEQVEDLLDDYSYKCEELEKSQCLTRRARCYLELTLIQQELQNVIVQLKADDVPRCLWEIAQDTLACDAAEFHREAVRLLAESCEELHAMVGHTVKSIPTASQSAATEGGRSQ